MKFLIFTLALLVGVNSYAEREALGSVFDPSTRELGERSKTTTHGGGGAATKPSLGSRIYDAIKKTLSMDNAKGAGDLLITGGDSKTEGDLLIENGPGGGRPTIEPFSGLEAKALLQMADVLSNRNTVLVITGATTAALLGTQLVNMARNARYAALAIVIPPSVINEMFGQKSYAIPPHDLYSKSDVQDLAHELAQMDETEAKDFIANEVDPELAAYYDIVGRYVINAQWHDQNCTDNQCI